jgi:hypothetical protein
MGNTPIYLNRIIKMEKGSRKGHYNVFLKNGDIVQVPIDNPLCVLRIENYLRQPYSIEVDNHTKQKISEANKEKVPIVTPEYVFYFDDPFQVTSSFQNPAPVSHTSSYVRKEYVSDMMAYNKLTVHRIHFEALFNDVLANKPEIYEKTFRDRWSQEKEKFLKSLTNKINNFNVSKL